MPQPNKQSKQERKPAGLAVAAFALGIASIVLPFIGLALAILGIVFGIVILSKREPGKGFAITGIVTGGASIVLHVIGIIIIFSLATNAAEDPVGFLDKIPGVSGCTIDDAFSCDYALTENGVTIEFTNERPGTTTINSAEAIVTKDFTTPEDAVECKGEGAHTIGYEEAANITLTCDGQPLQDALIAFTFTYQDDASLFGREGSGIIVP
ncbi:DUF4190 domain-containing protein [Candidatus Woesearchaeota archaeon]|nr:DUF4190 domain-containing protein [Candidatus Woesearchaeota archaeon]